MYHFGNDVSFIRDGHLFRLRAAAVIIRDGKVLMAGNPKNPYLYSVGGAVHFDETVEDAVVRETFEETGHRLEVDRLLAIHQNFFTDQLLGQERWHELAFYFLMKDNGQDLTGHESYQMTGDKETLQWVPIDRYGRDIIAYPLFLKDLEALLEAPTPPLLVNVEEPILATDRLMLLPMGYGDIDTVAQHFTAEVTPYMYPAPAPSRADTEAFYHTVEATRMARTDFHFVIRLKDSLDFVGMAGLHQLNTDTPELGIWTATSMHGHGYGLEAIRALMAEAQARGYTAVIYPVDHRNHASVRIPVALGGTQISDIRQVPTADGRVLEEVVYRIPLTPPKDSPDAKSED